MNLHIICERDAGLFSLIQQVIGNIPWALCEGRIPIVYFGSKTAYWTPRGYHGKDTVWEYYFEPLVPTHPVASIPQPIRDRIASKHPSPFEVGYFADAGVFVSSHFGDHHDLRGRTLPIPYLWDDPGTTLRLQVRAIIEQYIRPRDYVLAKVDRFYREHLEGHYVLGVHVRGTDATSKQEIRPHRQGSLALSRYVAEIDRLLRAEPTAKILVATDAEASLAYLTAHYGPRVVTYDSLRHQSGEAAGVGPTGWIMPAYIAGDRDRAARNGEEALIEFLLLSRCQYLIHNASSLARTVLLNVPELPHTNTHRKRFPRYLLAQLRYWIGQIRGGAKRSISANV